MVEFALVAPLLLFLLIGMVVLGLAINAKIVVSGAAREAGRSYAVYKSYDQARQRAREAIVGGGLPEEFQGEILFDPYQDVEIDRTGDYVTSTVTYRQPTFLPLLPRLINPDAEPWQPFLQLTSSAVFRVE